MCGLEVSANKVCGDTFKIKKFDILGCIKVCEQECVSGCEGARTCTDGRYTATQQRFTRLQDKVPDLTGAFGGLCEDAAGAIP